MMARDLKTVARVTVALAAAVSFTSCSKPPQRPAPQPPTVPVAVAAQGSARPFLTLAGFVAPAQSVALSSTLQEPAIQINVQEGDHVRRGEVLAQLQTADLRAQLNFDLHNAAANNALTSQNVYQGKLSISQGHDTVTQAQANLRAAQATLMNAQKDLQRYQMLYSQGYVTQQQVATQETTVENDTQAVHNTEAALSSAQSNVTANGTLQQGLQAAKISQAHAEAQAALDQASIVRVSINTATIRSPINGIVVNRNLNLGEYPGTRQLFTLQEEDYVFAILGASSAAIFQIPIGAPVSITAKGLKGKFSGKVVAVLDQLTPGSTNFAIKVRVPNPRGILRSGVAVSSAVSLTPVSGIAIPYTAFLDDNHNTVMVVDGNNVTHIADVTERGADGRVAIVSGLSAGARVVANGQLGLSDGEKVAFQKSP